MWALTLAQIPIQQKQNTMTMLFYCSPMIFSMFTTLLYYLITLTFEALYH